MGFAFAQPILRSPKIKKRRARSPASVLSAEPTSPSRGELAAAIARALGGCNDLSPQRSQYVGRRLALQRKASHDSHVTLARLYAAVMSLRQRIAVVACAAQ